MYGKLLCVFKHVIGRGGRGGMRRLGGCMEVVVGWGRIVWCLIIYLFLRDLGG